MESGGNSNKDKMDDADSFSAVVGAEMDCEVKAKGQLHC